MIITVFTYNREKMLGKLLKHLDGKNVLVMDDHSDYDIYQFEEYADIYSAPENRGKQGYWKQWQIALQYLEDNSEGEDLFVFTADDFQELDTERIKKVYDKLRKLTPKPFLVNLVNDGRTQCFTAGEPKPTQIAGQDFLKINWTDCGFFCNRLTLEYLRWWIEPIPIERWSKRDDLSSGVGHQLTLRLRGVTRMYLPIKSFAKHGDHVSQMHPKERIKNPLISKH